MLDCSDVLRLLDLLGCSSRTDVGLFCYIVTARFIGEQFLERCWIVQMYRDF